MAKAFTDTERDRIHLRLIQTGKKVINAAGLRSVVIDDVAKEAGISKGSFYSFFPSREDFILSVLESWEGEHRDRLFNEVLESSGKAKEVLEQFFFGLIHILEKEAGLARLSFTEIDRIIERLPPERIAAHKAHDKKIMENVIFKWIEKGILRPEDLEAFAGIPVALFALAMHREEFPQGTYTATMHRIASSLAESFAYPSAHKGEIN